VDRPVLLSKASVLIGDDFAEADVLVAGGRIARIFRGKAAAQDLPAGSEVLELQGCRLMPGFIDVHTHGAAGVDFNHASAEDVAAATRFFSSCGVTSYLPTILTDSPETMSRQLSVVTDPAVLAGSPQLIGVHLEGPFLCAEYRGAQPERFLRPCGVPLFGTLQEAARGRIALLTMSPELEGAPAFIRELSSAGVRVSIGHSAASYDQAMAAIEAGAVCATHVMNSMKLLHMHDPAILTAVLESDIFAEMICDGIHLHPPIVRLLVKAKGIDRMIAVTDSIMAAGLGDGSYVLGSSEVLVVDGDARLASNGVRAGSTLTMIQALRNIGKFSGLGLARISRLVSENPARMLGIFGDTGSIAEGKQADLVALDSGTNVVMTMARGRVVYESE
jgi:N-acetylglucosamine-6-phosphate deacetylase